jgi:hypothetical protein
MAGAPRLEQAAPAAAEAAAEAAAATGLVREVALPTMAAFSVLLEIAFYI